MTPAACFATAPGTHEIVLAEGLLVSLEQLPADVTRMMVLYQDAPLLDGLLVAYSLLSSSLYNCRSGFCLAESVCTGKDGIGQNPKDSVVHR